ncbi:MAG: hypothetical protein HOV80_03825 [Polyangiaceae bacterium]|nr:hypothetical protein [Polyangiaceae bacterium]
MRVLRIEAALAASALLTACILGEAQKIEGGSGAGDATSTTTDASASSGMGGDGLGGAGGMPPTCTSDMPGSVDWIVHFTDVMGDGGGGSLSVADQRITQLAAVPDGVLALGQYTERMTVGTRVFPPANPGNAFLAWFAPDGTFATDAGDDKIVVYGGGPPLPRGLAADGDTIAVVGAFSGNVTVGSEALPGTAGDRDAFVVMQDGTGVVTADAYAGIPNVPPPRDHFDDVVVTSNGTVIVSGYTDDGLSLPGGDIPADTTFIAAFGATEWVIPFATGYVASDAIQLALGEGDRLFIATSIKVGQRSLLLTDFMVTSLSGVLVAEIDVETPLLVGYRLFQGDMPMGDQAFLRDLVVGPDGSLAIVGTFFGDLIFDFGMAQLVSATQAGQTDGFVAVLDPADLGPTHWARFGSGEGGEETVWAASIDICGDVSILGTFAGPIDVPGGTLEPIGEKPVYVMKLARQAGGMLVPEWNTVFDLNTHLPCAAASSQIDRNCYRLVATETGVYAAGAFAGGVGFSNGEQLDAGPGEDAYLVKLSP